MDKADKIAWVVAICLLLVLASFYLANRWWVSDPPEPPGIEELEFIEDWEEPGFLEEYE